MGVSGRLLTAKAVQEVWPQESARTGALANRCRACSCAADARYGQAGPCILTSTHAMQHRHSFSSGLRCTHSGLQGWLPNTLHSFSML